MIRRLAGAVRSSSGSNSRSGRRPKDRNAGGLVRLLRRDAAGQPATGKLRCEEGNRGVYGLARTGHSPTNSCQELAKPGVYLRPIRRVDHRVRSSTDRARGMPINQLQVKQAWPRRSRNGFQVLALDGLASAGTVHDAEFLRHYRETGDRRRLKCWSTGTPERGWQSSHSRSPACREPAGPVGSRMPSVLFPVAQERSKIRPGRPAIEEVIARGRSGFPLESLGDFQTEPLPARAVH